MSEKKCYYNEKFDKVVIDYNSTMGVFGIYASQNGKSIIIVGDAKCDEFYDAFGVKFESLRGDAHIQEMLKSKNKRIKELEGKLEKIKSVFTRLKGSRNQMYEIKEILEGD